MDAIRMQGIEASAEENNVLVERIQLFGSATSVDSRIVSDPTSAGTNPLTGNPDTVVGNRVPYVPDWRVKFGSRTGQQTPGRGRPLRATAASSTRPCQHRHRPACLRRVRQVHRLDTKLHYEPSRNLSFDFGIDNVLNEQYFLFHPFPGRTYVVAARYRF